MKLADSIQAVLDFFFEARKWFGARIAYYSLRLIGVEVQFEDVKNESYSDQEFSALDLSTVTDPDLLLHIATSTFESSKASRLTVMEKSKALLTLSSLLLALMGAMLPKVISPHEIFVRGLIFVAILSFLNSIILLLSFLGIGRDMEILVDQDDANKAATDFKKTLINDYRLCKSAIDSRTRYLVDVYRAARFFFICAFLSVSAVVVVSYVQEPSVSSNEVLETLKKDKAVRELLRGEQGPPGITGPPGPKGNAGKDAELPGKMNEHGGKRKH